MTTNRLAVIAALSFAAVAAQAETPDLSGQFATRVQSTTARAQVVQAAQAPRQGVSPWSIQYNPLATFKSQKSRAEVRDELLRNRDAVTALTAEDSGSAYLATQRVQQERSQLAGQPRAAQ